MGWVWGLTMRLAVGLLALGFAALAWIVWTDHQGVIALQANLTAIRKSGAVSESEKCAAQAEKTFRSYGYRSDESSLTNPRALYASADFESRFNQKINKCFVLMDVTMQTIESRSLLDAYGRASYGFISLSLTTQTALPERRVISCDVGPENNSRQCKSEKEFDALIAPYWGTDPQ
jgi:hypothetical protein